MEILGQTQVQSILFFTLYGISGAVPFIAALYLLLRPYNAFSADIKPPVRLRRWAAVFLAFSALTHVWWLLFFIFSRDQQSVVYQLIIITDSVLLLTTIAGTMLSMLQDRRRPVWHVLAALTPFVGLGIVFMAYPSDLLKQMAMAYLLLLGLSFTVYMVFAIRRYDRWLNDNYADLEHKRVWLSQVVAFLCMLLFMLYVIAEDMVLIFCLHIVDLVLVFLLLWRVETLPTLEGQTQADELSAPVAPWRGVGGDALDQIEQLLKEHCVAPQLYLQHDLTLQQLAQVVGTNRSYLSYYFSRQGITYNTYINNLRITHFIKRYEELVKSGESVSTQQLASESGFRSYSTFSRAFSQRTGQSVTAWMRGTGE